MKKLLAPLALALMTFSLHAAITAGHPDYDPFADASGSGGTTYSVGANLIGQTNAQGLTWAGAGTSNNFQPKINSGNLSVTGLAPSTGNSVSYGFASANTGDTARLGLGGAITTGTVYYSMILELTGGLDGGNSGAIIAGFNNSTGAQGTQPTVIYTRLYYRTNGTTTYNLGVSKTGTTIVYDSGLHSADDILFVVGSYTYNPSAGDDVSSLWINPNQSTFGAATAPTPTVTDSTGTDGTTIASFLLRQGSSLEPNMVVDDIRVGVTWADVTPPPTATSAPFSITSESVDNSGNITLVWSSTATAIYHIVGSATVNAALNTWSPVGSSVTATGSLTTNTVPTGSLSFFEVISP